MIGAHTGLPWPAIYHRRGGGGGGYRAKAVTLAASTGEVEIASLTCANSHLISGYEWINGDFTTQFDGPIGISLDADDTGDAAYMETQIVYGPGFGIYFSEPTFVNQLAFKNSQVPADNVWTQIAWAANTHSRIAIIITDGVTTDPGVVDPLNSSGGSFDPEINGKPSHIYPVTTPRSYSDTVVWAGQYIDWTNLTNLAKIRNGSGKPIDPAVSIAAFGTPVICFSGDSSTYGNNSLGSGGAFTMTDVTNAPTSPSD